MNRLLVVLLSSILLLASCRKETRLSVGAVEDRSGTPVLDTRGVTTLISDSGIIRYRINTAVWQIYDKAEPSYWEFPAGIFLERFNEDLKVDASLCADYAIYNQPDQLWRLEGNVHALNLEGEEFVTEELFWDQKAEKIYTDSLITVTKTSSVIVGIGFVSDQSMSKYTILHPTGYFPIEDEDDE
jgi:LPS export ABC transporter protein LptC